MQFYRALYTHQKTKKAKTWQDGLVKYNEESRSAILYSDAKEQLDKYKCPTSKSFEIGEEYDFGRFLVQLESFTSEEQERNEGENQQENTNDSTNEPKNSISKRFKSTRPFKVPLALAQPVKINNNAEGSGNLDTSSKCLCDNDLLEYLNGNISGDKLGALMNEPFNLKNEFLTAGCIQKSLSFSDSGEELIRKTTLPCSFQSIAQYKNSFANALWEIIQLNITKMYRDISKDISSPSSSGQTSWHVHSVNGIKESHFKIGKNDLFMERKIIITIGDVKKEEFSKDDLWIVFDKQLVNYFIALSSFHGPNGHGELELKVFKEFEFSLLLRNKTIGKKCIAIKNGEISSEILLHSHLKDPAFDLSSLESTLLCEYRPQILVPLGKLNTKIDELSNDITRYYNLNVDQTNILMRFKYLIFTSQPSSPFLLVHGVFGAGKSFLIAVLIIFIYRAFKDVLKVPMPKLLISSMTNVAVDRVLSCLLELKFDSFLRIGSLKKINKRILPFSMQSLKNDEEVRELAEILKTNLLPQERNSIEKLIDEFKTRENARIVQEASVVGSTCIATTFETFNGLSFPIVILDEISQQIEPLSLLPLRLGCKRGILVGDPLQLSPTVSFSSVQSGGGIEKTLFNRLVENSHPNEHLYIQYRCNPQICEIVNDLFYANKIQCQYSPPDSFPLQPLVYLNVINGIANEYQGSLYNENEISVIKHFLLTNQENLKDLSIGIISFYKAQVNKLRLALYGIFDGQIATVDSFQGGERDVIILSLVKSKHFHNSSREPFIDCPERVNVALTRAKHSLVLVGNRNFTQQNPIWSKVLNYFPSNV